MPLPFLSTAACDLPQQGSHDFTPKPVRPLIADSRGYPADPNPVHASTPLVSLEKPLGLPERFLQFPTFIQQCKTTEAKAVYTRQHHALSSVQNYYSNSKSSR